MVINADGPGADQQPRHRRAPPARPRPGRDGQDLPGEGRSATTSPSDIALIQLQNASGLDPVPSATPRRSRSATPSSPWATPGARAAITVAAGDGHRAEPDHHRQRGRERRSETLHGMIQTNANIVARRLRRPARRRQRQVIGMDTAGNGVSDQQQASAGFAIPINTALSVARQIAGGPGQLDHHDRLPAFRGHLRRLRIEQQPAGQAQQGAAAAPASGGSRRCSTSKPG